MEKRMYKSKTDKKIAGVCGGIAKYFNVDSTIVRIIWAICIFVYGVGFFTYFIAAFIMPEEPLNDKNDLKRKNFENNDINDIEEAEKVE